MRIRRASGRSTETMRALVPWLALVCAAGCRCNESVQGVQATFRPAETSVDFGRVLENTTAKKSLLLLATERGSVDVELSVTGPFAVPMQVTVPGGSEVAVQIEFNAGSQPVTGTLALKSARQQYQVELKGTGVRPKDCSTTQACREGEYIFESDSCVLHLLADGTACEPDSLCLEKGECRAGVCQGVARLCDDSNVCTVDACAPDVGCLHTPRVCPAPSDPCQVATCERDRGCGQGPAPDGTVCGSVDCVTAHLCVFGACQAIATPDGTLCAPKSPCQGEGRCLNHACVRPDAGELSPDFSLSLPGTPLPAPHGGFLAAGGNLFAEICDLPRRPLEGDGGSADGGFVSDGGVELGCALVSYTGTGFERFTAPHPDGGMRQLLHVAQGRVAALHEGRKLEWYATRDGTLNTAAELDGKTLRESVAATAQGELWACVQPADGGAELLRFELDGGRQTVGRVPLATWLAIDEQGAAHAYAPTSGMLSSFKPLDDGGHVRVLRDAGIGSGSLVAAQNQAWVGGTVLFPEDGGAATWTRAVSDAGAVTLLSPGALSDGNFGVLFYRQCAVPQMSCVEAEQTLFVQAVNLSTGATRWEAVVADAGMLTHVNEAVLLEAGRGTVAAVTERSPFDGGLVNALEIYAEGKQALACAFPSPGRLAAAVFEAGMLFTVFERDGGFMLEAYDVSTLRASTQGWPSLTGISGTRRARP